MKTTEWFPCRVFFSKKRTKKGVRGMPNHRFNGRLSLWTNVPWLNSKSQE